MSRLFGSHNVVVEKNATGISWLEARDADKHPTLCTGQTLMPRIIRNVSGAEAEKPLP